MTTLLRQEHRRISFRPFELLTNVQRHPRRDKWRYQSAHHDECRSPGKDFSITFLDVLRKALSKHPETIEMTHEVLAGAPRIAGTRIPVYMVLDAVQHYGNLDGAVLSYPQLTIEQIRDALAFVADVLEQPLEYEDTVTD
jgi:uncharacterized protein (DUF433 family)